MNEGASCPGGGCEGMKTVIGIVKAHLEQNGYDGLARSDIDCGCPLRDFQPCGENFSQCQPAYEGVDEYGHLYMYLSQEDANKSRQERPI